MSSKPGLLGRHVGTKLPWNGSKGSSKLVFIFQGLILDGFGVGG